MALGTSFEQIEYHDPLPKDDPTIQNINAFRPVFHIFTEKKIFEDLSKFYLFCPLLGPKKCQPLYLKKKRKESSFPKHVSYQMWLKWA